MSLDELAKKRKQEQKQQQAQKQKQQAQQKKKQEQQKKQEQLKKQKQKQQEQQRQQKQQRRGGSGPVRRQGRARTARNNAQPYGGGGGGSGNRRGGRNGSGAILSRLGDPQRRDGTEVNVRGLHYNIESREIRELFGHCGKLIAAEVNFDRSGRSIGTASVTFVRREDALKAVRDYNQRTLDGKVMHVAVVNDGRGGRGGGGGSGGGGGGGGRGGGGGARPKTQFRVQLGGSDSAFGGRGRGRGRGRGGNGKGKGGGGAKGGGGRGGGRDRKPVSAEDLDKGMDAYFAARDGGSAGDEGTAAE